MRGLVDLGLQATFWMMIACDVLMLREILSYIRSRSHGGWCGTWAISSYYKMVMLGVVSLILAGIMCLCYRCDCRRGLSESERLLARIPFCCMAALLCTDFGLFPLI